MGLTKAQAQGLADTSVSAGSYGSATAIPAITVGTNKNGMVAGPFSMGSYTLTIPSGSVFTVV